MEILILCLCVLVALFCLEGVRWWCGRIRAADRRRSVQRRVLR